MVLQQFVQGASLSPGQVRSSTAVWHSCVASQPQPRTGTTSGLQLSNEHVVAATRVDVLQQSEQGCGSKCAHVLDPHLPGAAAACAGSEPQPRTGKITSAFLQPL
jgi:hypothetical protein